MALDPHEAAKKALIAYRQLNEIAKEPLSPLSAASNIESYNRILDTLNECFGFDDSFIESIRHLQHLGRETPRLSNKMGCDGKVLLATAHSFIELYLSPEDKKKAFGFHA